MGAWGTTAGNNRTGRNRWTKRPGGHGLSALRAAFRAGGFRRSTARGLAGLLVAAAVIPVGAQSGSAFSGVVISNANVLNGSVALLATATVNIAAVGQSQYPTPASSSLASLTGLGLDSVASAGAVSSAATADPLYDTANSSADLASLNIASGLVALGPTHSQCVATGSGVTGSSTVTGLNIGGGLTATGGIPSGAVAANTTVPLKLGALNAGSIILNYQSTANQGAQQYSTKVIAARVSISVAGLANVNVDIGTSECGTSTPTVPSISAIAPVQGPEAGGTSVAITGSGFRGTTGVTFGTTSATSYTIDSLTGITAVAPAGTSTRDVRVVNPAGTSSNTSADDFTYVPRPVITAVSPVRGPTAGGTSVTITGTSLLGTSAVTFGGTAATSFTVDSATQITAVAPARTAGLTDVRVTSVGGPSDVVVADQYTYIAVPAVTAVAPSVGAIAGGTSVTLTGTALGSATSVKFGAVAGAITANTATSITVTSPAGSAGTADITVTTAGGTSANTAADNFTYVAQPTVTNVSPSSGPAAGGTSVTLTGTGFAGLSGAAAVQFGGTNATSYTVNSATSITALAPAGSPGTIDVTVANPAGTSSVTAADQFTNIALPTVTGLSPATGATAGGTPVTITGTGFTGATAVSFGTGNNASVLTVVSPTQITATVPAHAAGSVDVRVVTPGGTSANTAADDYVYAAAPTVTGIAPTAGPLAGGTSVTITGTSLTNASSVRFGGTPATFTVNSATSITATSPLANTAGAVDITVVTAGGTSATSAADRFTYTAAPVITSISPSQASSTGGALLVTINGSGFTGANALSGVKFDGQNVVAVPLSDSVITVAVVPAHAVGPVFVTVTTPSGGTSAQTPAAVFTYLGAPTLTSVTPASGPTAGGNTVTLTGTGFTNVDTVNFGPIPVTGFTRVSDTQITVTAPPGLAGTVNVSVLSLQYGVSGNQPYQYLATPTVLLLAPNSGPAAGGQTVTITGTGFTGATEVRFGGVLATGTTVSNDLSITTTVPAHAAGTADVTVTAPGGTSSTAGTLNDYTYVAAPVVSSIAPAFGPATGLNSVVITGTGFTGRPGCMFGGVTVTALAVNDTTINVSLIPSHAAGDVNVAVTTLNGGTSAATAASVYTYQGAPTLSALTPNQGPLAGGNQIALTGTGFNQATAVTFGILPATAFTITSDTQITATVPLGVGTTNVTVSAGAFNNSNALPYTYVAAPALATLSPSTGTIDGGTVVTLTGLGFSGATDVRFGATSAPGPITVSGDTGITVTTPAHAVGAVPVTVVGPGGTSTPIAILNDFTFIARPVVTAVAPNSGPTGGLTPVTITGTGFDTVPLTGAVTFGGVAATYLKLNDTTITATTPAHGAGTVDVAVTTADGGTSAPGSAATFTYLGAPAVTGVSPATGPLAGGGTVTITGAGFTPASTVLFGAVPILNPTVNGQTITVTAPAGVGTVDVRVLTAGGTSPATAADDYTYVGTPVVSGLAPTAGGVAGGETVNITGSGFTGVTGVDFGGTAAAAIDQRSDTLIVATAPAHPAGVTNVHVTTLIGGVSANQAANVYTFVAGPVVTGLSPAGGTTDGGTTVTITGSGFLGATGVRFGNVVATSPTVVSDTTMTAVSPAGSVGPVAVTVLGLFATSAPVPAGQFTYLGRPDITGLAPDSGSTAGGTVVSISGTGFTAGSTVTFDGNAATAVQFVSATQLSATSPPGTAGVVNVAVTTNGGTSLTTGARDDFRYVGTSTITTITPAAGPVAGGTSIVITGTQFYDVTGVSFGGTAAATLTRDSATQLTVLTPAHAAGPVNVVVTTTSGGASAAGTYTYEPLPTVSAITPANGPNGGGTVVRLTGTGFTGTTQVRFGTTPATAFTVLSDTQIDATSPPMSAGGTVHLTAAGVYGTSVATASDEFTYAASPTIAGIAPARGPLTGGTDVTITGTGFTSGSTVSFGGTAATVRFVSATELVATTPPGPAGTVSMTVTTAFGPPASIGFAYVDIPGITSVTPNLGPEPGGTAVVVIGSGFLTASAVRFGTTPAAFTIVSDTQISTTSPGGTGGVNVRITNDGGTSVLTGQSAFTYQPPPTVTALAPSSGPVTGGTGVTITGTGFTNATTVTFGGVAATGVTYLSATQLTAIAPSTSSASTVDVVASTVNGSSASAGPGNDFLYLGPPSVTGVTPPAGPVAGGTVVTLSGSGFTGATQVRFGAVLATGVTVSTDGSITVTAPAAAGAAPGLVDITVTGPAGTSTVTAADQFRYASTPAVTGISPAAGPVAGGTTVTITGSGFAGATQVSFGGAGATSFTVLSDTSITAVTPSGLAGARTVRITTPGGISPAATYTYLAAPDVTGLTPSVGPTAGGTTATITGTGFTGATTVSFDGITTTPTLISDTSLTVITPVHAAGTVDVTVTGPSGVSATGPDTQFQYVAPGSAPVLTTITPARGPAAGGGAVTLTGIGFTGATAVSLGGVAAPFTVTSDTRMTVTVPVNGSGSVTVRVTTASGTSTDAVTYTYVPLSELPQIQGITPNAGPVAGGTVLTVTGANFDEQTTVSFDGVAGTGLTLGPDTGASGLVVRSAVPALLRAAYSSTLTVTAPSHAQGPVTVQVTNAAGSTSFVQAFTFIPVPAATSFAVSVPAGSTSVIAPRGEDYAGLAVSACGTPAGAGSVTVGATGQACVYTAPDAAGTDGFTMDVTDVIGQPSTQTVQVTVTQDAGGGDTGGGGGNDDGGDDNGGGSGGGTGGGGRNDSGDGDGSGSGSGSGAGGTGSGTGGGHDLAFTGTPYFLVPAIGFGFGLILVGSGIVSFGPLRVGARRRRRG